MLTRVSSSFSGSRELRGRKPALEIAGDIAESAAQVGSDRAHDHHGRHRNQGRDQPVFDGGRPFDLCHQIPQELPNVHRYRLLAPRCCEDRKAPQPLKAA